MPLSEDETRVYQQTLETAQRQMQDIDQQIEKELADVKERLSTLRDQRKAFQQMFDAACAILGVASELEGEDGNKDTESTQAPISGANSTAL